jgi:hypothetical protein
LHAGKKVERIDGERHGYVSDYPVVAVLWQRPSDKIKGTQK